MLSLCLLSTLLYHFLLFIHARRRRVFCYLIHTFYDPRDLSLSYFKWFENPSSSSENVLASFVKFTVYLLAQVIVEEELEKGSEKRIISSVFSTTRENFSPSSFYYRQTSLSFSSQICVPSSSTPVMIIWLLPPLALILLSFITLQLHSKHFFEIECFSLIRDSWLRI